MNYNILTPQPVEFIINNLELYGFETYVVGGCVRDSLLGRKPHDWDLCTSASPDDVLELFKTHRTVLTGIEYGTVTIVINDVNYEITTFRSDGEYSNGRSPENVCYVKDLLTDLSRRDFTMNAIAFSHKRGLVDPFGGAKDIENRVIKCVGDANLRFSEDGLRILRALRFAITFNFTIDKDTKTAIMSHYSGLSNTLSGERVGSELVKMLCSQGDITKTFLEYREVIAEFIPEFSFGFDFQQHSKYHRYDVYEHILRSVDFYKGKDTIIKLSLLFHDIGKPLCYTYENDIGHFYGHGRSSQTLTYNIMKRLKFDNGTIEMVSQLVFYHDGTLILSNQSIKKWLNLIGEKQLHRMFELKEADICAQSGYKQLENLENICLVRELCNKTLEEKECFLLSDLKINGDDLITLGFKRGKRLGDVLKILLDIVITDNSKNEVDYLLKVANELLHEQP